MSAFGIVVNSSAIALNAYTLFASDSAFGERLVAACLIGLCVYGLLASIKSIKSP